MSEGLETNEWAQRSKSLHADPNFHLDPSKEVDPLERRISNSGVEGAFDELMQELDERPDDAELRRQADLLVNRMDDLASKMRKKLVS